jgi:putative Mg2+ transporter-C (MgtC) family protein
MDILWEELTFGLPERRQLIQVIVRLVAAVLLGGLIGLQRESAGKAAGLRTHILVALGSTAFVVGCFGAGFDQDAVSRVIQGIVTGIGFIGTGTIIKRGTSVEGLTTSAGLWTTCAVGIVIGLGELGIALIATAIAFIVLTVIAQVESRLGGDTLDNDKRKGDARGGDIEQL